MLDAEERAAYEAESQQLRLALKTWETTWAREHDGAKPGRDDIKRNAEIAQKYTAYNRVRGILSGKIAVSDANEATKRKRKQTAATTDTNVHNIQTPSKRLRAARATPMKAATAATPTPGGYLDAAAAMTPSISRKLFSPVVPTSIGPTPQRDGRVLGLFDVLNEEEEKRRKRSAVEATPSKRTAAGGEGADTGAAGTTAADPVSFALLGATPRKQTLNVEGYGSDADADDDDDNVVNVRRLGRTPMSSGRRNLLNHFTAGGGGTLGTRDVSNGGGVLGTTPLKTRDANIQQQQQQQQSLLTTPSKSGGFQQPFATPAFLRRQSGALPPVDENGEFMSPPGRLRLPRKPLVRGLSSVLASLRKVEDEQLDEQLDVLRDLEDEMDMNARPAPKQVPNPAQLGKPLPAAAAAAPGAPRDGTEVQVEDSQLQQPQQEQQEQQPRLLGGFDDEGLYDSAPEEQVGRDGQPLRVYKKKGQKRTTRRSNMRPTRTKRPAAGTMAESDSEDEEDEGVVPETQVHRGEGGGEGGDDDAHSGSEFGSDGEEADKAKKPKKLNKAKKDKKSAKAGDGKDGSKDGTVKKVVRKVNELAHANFMRLKLRNNGSKGGPGFNSRFRRRR